MSDDAQPPLALHERGWLGRLLQLYIDQHDPHDAERSVIAVVSAFPADVPREVLADEIAKRRLRTLRLQTRRQVIANDLRLRLIDAGLSRDDLMLVGMLATQWDILLDIARLYDNTSGRDEAQLELLTIMALGLKQYELARELHEAHLGSVAGRTVNVSDHADQVEAKLAKHNPGREASFTVGVGLLYFEARSLGKIAASYFEQTAVVEERIAQLHALGLTEKLDLIEVLLAVAWADGRIDPAERSLVEQQIDLASFDKATSKRLRAHLDRAPTASDLILRPLDAGARRFILEQGILLSLVDDERDPREHELLKLVARKLGGSERELEAVMIEVTEFYELHKGLIQELGPTEDIGFLRRMVIDRAQKIITTNLAKLVTEIKETGELAMLLTTASVRELTAEEAVKVRAQLLDVCKTVPALAIFALPGGGILLPILIRALPFNILPSAFAAVEAAPEGPQPS